MAAGESENVRVAVRMRPLNSVEMEKRARQVAFREPGIPQINIGEHHSFTFDEVFPTDATQEHVFDTTVRDLVDGTLEGRNATILAYGQTGSGKTHTMGTGFDVNIPPEREGMVPRATRYLFQHISAAQAEADAKGLPRPEFSVTVSFIELYMDRFRDLCSSSSLDQETIKVRDERNEAGQFVLSITGVSKIEVDNVDGVMKALHEGSLKRVTGATKMNNQSSRSHAIFTMWITHRRVASVGDDDLQPSQPDNNAQNQGKESTTVPTTEPSSNEAENPKEDGQGETEGHLSSNTRTDIITTTAKFNFVDLAGSERLKRTAAVGDRAKEGININAGLLALGNVISALGDPTKRGAHVPYRDSKLTRILQDSLGGNSRTLMIACISPSDSDFLETLNTLKYANRARNITNKVIVNQDSASREIQFLRETIQKLQIELREYRQGKIPFNPDSQEANDLYHEVSYLRKENRELKRKTTHLTSKNKVLEEQAASASMSFFKHLEEVMDVNGDVFEDGQADDTNGEEGGSTSSSASPTKKINIQHVVRDNIRLQAEVMALKDLVSRPDTTSQFTRTGTSQSQRRGSDKLAALRREVEESKRHTEKMLKEVTPKKGKKHRTVVDGERPASALQHSESAIDGGAEQQKPASASSRKRSERSSEGATSDAAEDSSGDTSPTATTELHIIPEQGDEREQHELEDTFHNSDHEDEDMDLDEVDEHDSDADLDAEDLDLEEEEGEEEDDEGGEEDSDDDRTSQLLHELSNQMGIQEKLLQKLADAESEINQQRQLYEERLKQEHATREQMQRERDELRRALEGLSSSKTEESQLLRQQYEGKLKDVQSRLHDMEKQLKRTKAEEESQRRAMEQIARLKSSIDEARQQRKVLMQRAQQELKDHRKKQMENQRQLASLQAKETRARARASKFERMAQMEKDQKYTLSTQNANLKKQLSEKQQELRELKAKQMRGNAPSSPTSTSRSTLQTVSQPLKRVRSRTTTSHLTEVAAERKRSILEREVGHAVAYHAVRTKIESLNASRDVCVAKRNSCFERLQSENVSEEEKNQLNEELEGLNNEHESLDEALKVAEGELLSMEARGISVTDSSISEQSVKLIDEIRSAKEARLLLQHLLSDLVHQELAAEKTRVLLKQLELENSVKDQLFESLTHHAGTGNRPRSRTSPLRCTSPTTSQRPAASIHDVNRVRSKSSHSPLAGKEPAVSGKRHETSELKARGYRAASERQVAQASDLRSYGRAQPTADSADAAHGSGDGDEGAAVGEGVIRRVVREDTRRNKGASSVTSSTSSLASSKSGYQEGGRQRARFIDQLRGGKRRAREVAAPSEAFVKATAHAVTRLPSGQKHGANASWAESAPRPTLSLQFTITGHEDEVHSVAASDGQLLTGGKDRAVRVWDLETHKLTACLTQHEDIVRAVARSTTRFFTCCSNIVRMWDPREASQVERIALNNESGRRGLGRSREHISSFALDEGENYFYAALGKALHIWDIRMGSELKQLSIKNNITALALHDMGSCLAVGAIDRQVRLFDVRTLSGQGASIPYKLLEPPHVSRVSALAWCHNVLYSASEDASIKKWTGTDPFHLHNDINVPRFGNAIKTLHTLPGQRCFVSGTTHGSLKLWDSGTCALLGEVKAHAGVIHQAASVGNMVFTASADKTVKVWHYDDERPAVIMRPLSIIDMDEATQRSSTSSLASSGRQPSQGSNAPAVAPLSLVNGAPANKVSSAPTSPSRIPVNASLAAALDKVSQPQKAESEADPNGDVDEQVDSPPPRLTRSNTFTISGDDEDEQKENADDAQVEKDAPSASSPDSEVLATSEKSTSPAPDAKQGATEDQEAETGVFTATDSRSDLQTDDVGYDVLSWLQQHDASEDGVSDRSLPMSQRSSMTRFDVPRGNSETDFLLSSSKELSSIAEAIKQREGIKADDGGHHSTDNTDVIKSNDEQTSGNGVAEPTAGQSNGEAGPASTSAPGSTAASPRRKHTLPRRIRQPTRNSTSSLSGGGDRRSVVSNASEASASNATLPADSSSRVGPAELAAREALQQGSGAAEVADMLAPMRLEQAEIARRRDSAASSQSQAEGQPATRRISPASSTSSLASNRGSPRKAISRSRRSSIEI